MSVDPIVAELLAGQLNEFTNRRNTKAKELKANGKSDQAAAVATLKKPPAAVWAVNQLRLNKPMLERLHRAGASVVDAQRNASTGRGNAARELRSASDALQRELDAAVRAAGDTLRTSGHSVDEAALRRMQEIFRLAAVTGGDMWDQLQAGALIEEPKAGEDMLTAAFAPGGGVGARSTATAPTRARDAQTEREAAKQAAETEKRLALEHAVRVAKLDDEEAQEVAQTAQRLREEADRVAADAKRANEKAKTAEKQSGQAAAKAKASSDALRRLRR
ncbi:MAG: hypothetical protein M3Z11_05495 [Candidatus Dormibacteraeota bacterium]|nr:hypothetical protein [Candidatus Dormibacteraeota bacterium]